MFARLSVSRAAPLLLLLCGMILLAWLVRPATTVIALAVLYAFVTWPIAKALASRIPLATAVLLVNGGLALTLLALLFVLGPVVYAQTRSLIGEMPAAITTAVQSLPESGRSGLAAVVQAQAGNLAAWSREALGASVGVLRSAAGVVGAIILIPVLAAYLQYDKPRYERAILAIVPSRQRDAFTALLSEIARVAGAFIRAQLIVSSIVGVLAFVVLTVTGVPFASTIALVTAIADLVPYLGGIAAFVPSLILAFAFGGLWKALLVAALLAVVFEIEAQFLQPQIVGARMHLPASAVVIALLVGGALFGVLGLYLAVPIAASLPAIVRFALSMPNDDGHRDETRVLDGRCNPTA
jgi:predicted PurR-regulated permease PerM